MSLLLGLDPGPVNTGWAIYHPKQNQVHQSGVWPNQEVLGLALTTELPMAVEMIASYGMAVGREVFETCVWIGRYVQAYRGGHGTRYTLVYRREVKLHLCGQPRAKDPNIRQALLDLIGPPGTKREPGPTYGVKGDAWAALGVAVTASDGAEVSTPWEVVRRPAAAE